MHPHGVDYSRTSSRLGWLRVPAAAVDEFRARLGSPVAAASAAVGSGFGGQYAGITRLEDGRLVFAKASSRLGLTQTHPAPPLITLAQICRSTLLQRAQERTLCQRSGPT